MGFMGYERPDGSVGVRNYVAVISTVACANSVVNAIARAVPEVKAITHTEGCGRGPADVLMSSRTLIGLCKNPNVAALLIVSLGCEVIKPEFIESGIGEAGKPMEILSIQHEGGSVKSVQKGAEIARKLVESTRAMERKEFEWAKLTVGLECGGSDAMSGVTANPMVGVAADWLVGEGGTVIISETTEMIGTEEILAKRAANAEVAKEIMQLIKNQEKLTKEILGPMADMVISPGNMDGGLSTIKEKSLGCIIKGGTTAIQQVLDYGEAPLKKGLVIMDTPGSDIFSLTGMAAGGAQVMIFTTGRGTPAGFPVVPVIKVASNTEIFEKMNDDMDLNAGRILEGVPMEEAGRSLIELFQKVAAGQKTKAEINLNDVLAIHTVGPSF